MACDAREDRNSEGRDGRPKMKTGMDAMRDTDGKGLPRDGSGAQMRSSVPFDWSAR
jgi:hypothetical protein